ncbi:DUF2530 domain-containing protein [Glycomyces arizonensis]|uniref:DUF2530 domain-containing protein n=1 Tax=Glycomyces arizonensis TaxID=256035 RepID=UPI0012EC7756|nr:DUF2530 domain-containing protein [Glycomyces arizonensis]
MSPDGTSQSSPVPSSTPRDAFKRVKRSPELPAPDAVQLRMTPIAVAGTLLWTIAWIVAQLFRDELADSGREWWVSCALCGVVLGILGTGVMVVMDRRHFSSRRGEDQSSSEPSSS